MRRPKRNLLDENSLYDYAVAALSRRMRSVAELKRLMRNRCPDEDVIEEVVARLKDRKYLNDSSYAAAYSAFRRDNQKFGRRRVVTDLKIKGIHSSVIERAVEEAYSEVDEAALARAFLKRKRLKKPASGNEAARIFRALMRAGFGVGTCVQVLKSWDVDDEVLTALAEGPDG
ncbi:MAG TPA: RecX family transcriptional regulator [Candidatus Angelobacter sp.]|nr:RecX family transcriptional regulator [Candidatus Angelobacter sp.]